MKYQILLILSLTFNLIFSQNIKEINDANGIWIAEKFYNSFEKSKTVLYSKSILNSKEIFIPNYYPKVFNPNYPVALRINKNEIKNGILNIGYSTLHNHLLYPEVSEYLIKNKDTIREQGSFKINLNQKDSLNYKLITSDIGFFNFNSKAYIKIKNKEVVLFRLKNGKTKQETIKYIRISTEFSKNYQFPNPLYYYTRKNTLCGKYTLKDNNGNILTENLEIEQNGKVKGSPIFKGKYAHYSTDAFCGPPRIDEYIMFCDIIEDYFDYNSIGFVYKRINENTIYLYDTNARNIFDDNKKLGEVKYKLIKH